MRKLISVHTPKAAGTSIRKILSDAFGDTFVADYRDDPADPLSERHLNPPRYFARNPVLAEGVNCIHGHFHPGQFRLDDEFLFTILRHPIDNVISIYTFWKSDRSNPTGLHAYFLANELDVLQLAQLPLIRHLYSYSYFGGFDMERFDAIGRHENRRSALAAVSDGIGIPIDFAAQENVTPSSPEREELLLNRGVLDALQDILADDIQFL